MVIRLSDRVYGAVICNSFIGQSIAGGNGNSLIGPSIAGDIGMTINKRIKLMFLIF